MANYIIDNDDLIDYSGSSFFKNSTQYEKIIEKRNLATHVTKLNKEQANIIARQIPLKLLALEWLNKIAPSTETRAYLIENFLPILVLGCEKLLKEAQNKNLIEQNKKDINFNPINYLAQFLMRNNPKYNNQNETSHYVRSMREVYQELRDQMFEIQGNKLAKLKEDVRKRRVEREKEEKLKQIEAARRKGEFERLFLKFHLSEYGRLEIAIILNAFNMYREQIKYFKDEKLRSLSSLNHDNFPSFCYLRDELNLTKRILKKEFIEVMESVTNELASDKLDYFVEFFEQCSISFCELANFNIFNRILKRVFKLIDSTNTGYLSRRRLIYLFEEFKNKRKMCEFRNPMEWPVLDPFIKFENKLQQALPSLEELEILEKQRLSKMNEKMLEKQRQKKRLEEEAAAALQQQQLNETDSSPKEKVTAATQNLAESIEPEPNQVTNETEETLAEDKTNIVEPLSEINEESTNNLLDTTTIEPLSTTDLVKPAPPHKELATASLTSMIKKQPSKSEDDDKPKDPNAALEKPNLTKDEELLFIKNAINYYIPLKEPLNAFDSNLIIEKKSNTLSESSDQQISPLIYKNSLLNDFDPEFVNEKQFLNMLHNFIMGGFLNSEIYVNDLITFIKDNFAENQYEKINKIKKAENIRRENIKLEKYAACFDKLDVNSNGTLNLNNLINVILNYKDGLLKEQLQNALALLADKILNKSGQPDQNITKEDFEDLITFLAAQIDSPKLQDQILNYLPGQFNNSFKVRSEQRRSWLEQIKYIGEITYGSFDPLYKQLFLTLLKDAENNGNGKNLSANVGILERVDVKTVGLKYHATTPHDSRFLLGKTLTRKNKNISFNVIDKATHEYVQRVRANSSVHYFNPTNQSNGSLVVFPLKYTRNKIFGTVGIDTLNDINESLFEDHEIAFYEGVVNTFAKSYTNIIFKNRLIKTCISAIEWLSKRCKGIEILNVYIVQLINNEFKLNPELVIDNQRQQSASTATKPTPLNQKSHSISLKPILKYLFNNGNLEELIRSNDKIIDEELENKIGSKAYECAITSETTLSVFNQQACYYVPLRNEKHKSIFVMEIKSKEYAENAQKYESELEQIETVLYVLHKCQEELLDEHFGGVTRKTYSFESQYEQDKFEILFEKIYLSYVNERIGKMETSNVVEIMPDGTKSPESSQANNLIKLIADLCSHEMFGHYHVIDKDLVRALSELDPTIENYSFQKSTSTFSKESDEEYLNGLNKFYVSLAKSNISLRLLTDWACLQRQLKSKTDRIQQLKISTNAMTTTTK